MDCRLLGLFPPLPAALLTYLILLIDTTSLLSPPGRGASDRPVWSPQSRSAAVGSLANTKHDLDLIKEQLEEERGGKSELQRLVSKRNTKVTPWRTKYETGAIQRMEELEETK